MTTVSDTSPIIALDRIGRLSILRDLYGSVLIPSAVERELLVPGDFRTPAWIVSRALSLPVPGEVRTADLGVGESEAIALAIESRATLLLLDDRAARALAKTLSLPVVGLGGVLIAAKQSGFLDSVATALSDVMAAGFRVSPRLRDELLRLAGETGSPSP